MQTDEIKPTGESHTPANHQTQMQDVEALTNELKKLLVKHETMLDEEGIKHEVEVLERWMESYRHGLAAATKISNTGMGWLGDLRDHLKLAADELQRLEGEGGNAPTRAQNQKTEELLNAIKRIDKVIPDLEVMFGTTHEPHKAAS